MHAGLVFVNEDLRRRHLMYAEHENRREERVLSRLSDGRGCPAVFACGAEGKVLT
jgi:hypothetical protein